MSDKENKNGNQDINEEVNENQEYELESLLGDDPDESEKIAEMLKNSETLSSGQNNEEPGLSEFLDEPDDAAGVDEALSQFVDDGESGEADEEDELKKKLDEEKLGKIKRIKRVSLIGALTVFVLAVGMLVFFMIYNSGNNFVLTYEREIDGKKQAQQISADEFKFLMLMSQSFNPIEGAMDRLITMLAVEKAADSRNISLSPEELQQVKATALEWKSYIEDDFPDLGNVSLEFLEKYHSLNPLAYMIFDTIFDEINAAGLDEADYALKLDEFINYSQIEYIDAMYKYMILNSEAKAAEAKAAIESGEMTVEEALIELYYNSDDFAIMYGFPSLADFLEAGGYETLESFIEENGYDMVHINNLGGFDHADILHLISLNANQVSNIIELDAESFVLFILESINIPSHEEIDERFKYIYIDIRAGNIFDDEYDRFYNEVESSVKINQRAIDSIDLDELFGGY